MKICTHCKINEKEYRKRYCTSCRELSVLKTKQKTKNSRVYDSKKRNADREYYHKNKNLSVRSFRASIWKKNNRASCTFWNSNYRTAKLQRTPKWLTPKDLIEIKSFYTKAAKLTKETGIEHQVDHIIPLQGVGVSGFHVPSNLQILTKSVNSGKGNKF